MGWSAAKAIIVLGISLVTIGIGGIGFSNVANGLYNVAQPALNSTAGIELPSDEPFDAAGFWVFFGSGIGIVIFGGVVYLKRKR